MKSAILFLILSIFSLRCFCQIKDLELNSKEQEPRTKNEFDKAKLARISFQKLDLNYKTLESDATGFPKRFSCKLISTIDAKQRTNFWEQNLVDLLGLRYETGVSYQKISEDIDKGGIWHAKFDQFYNGILVLGGQYFIHEYTDRQILGHGNVLMPESRINARIDSSQIQNFVENYFKNKNHLNELIHASNFQLAYWFNTSEQKWFLIYKTTVRCNSYENWMVYLDASTGQILKSTKTQCSFHIEDAHGVCDRKVCSDEIKNGSNSPNSEIAGGETTLAKDLNGVDRTINVWREGADVYLIDASKPMFKAGQFQLANPIGAIWTLDAKNSFNPIPGKDQISSKTNNFTTVSVSAHYNAGQVYDYFYNTHGRNSIDGKGTTISSYVNFGTNYVGAFWANGAIHYGNGNVSKGYLPFAKGIDISAHEISHGIIDATSGLEYDAETGAINESFADIFGVLVDRTNWTLGEDIIVPGHPIRPTGVERNMADPNQGLPKDSFRIGWQPKHVNQQYHGLEDGGGVHWNSGIPNHAFYLFVQGLIATAGSEETAKQWAEQIYYHALNFYLTRQADFKDLRAAIEQSSKDLYANNTNVLNAAMTAFDQVGITSSNNPGGGLFDFSENDLPVNPGTEFVVCTRFNVNANRNEGVFIRDMTTQSFQQLSNLNIVSKPSVTDDGNDIYFVATDLKVYRLHYNPSTFTYDQSLLIDNPIYRNVSVSKDGRFIALLELPTQNNNKLRVKDLLTQDEQVFSLTNTDLQVGLQSSTVTQIGSMDFDPSGQYIMYDCFSTNVIVGGNSFQQWDIGVLRFWDALGDQFGDGAIEKLFRAPLADINQDVVYQFRNPVFSKNSPYVLAFDFYFASFANQTYAGSFGIVGTNIEKGELKYIQQQRVGLAYPNYSMEDDSLSFDDGFQTPTRPTRIHTVGLAASKIDSNGTSNRFLNGYRWASRFGNGKRKLINYFPLAVADHFVTDEDQQLTATVVTNDRPSIDGSNNWKLKGANGGALKGTVTMMSDGQFVYKPDPNYFGSDQFNYVMCDVDSDCSEATVLIDINSVNDIPVAVFDNFITNEDQNLNGDVATNDQPCIDGGNQWKLKGTNGGALRGVVSMDVDGKFNYKPDADFHGQDEFTYTLCDVDSDCSEAIVKIEINSTNDIPTAITDNFMLDEDQELNADVALNDQPSPDGGNQWKLKGSNGGALKAIVTMSIDGKFNFKPISNYYGMDEFTYELCDANSDCAQTTVKVIINSVNDIPLAKEDNFTTDEDQLVSGTVATNDELSPDGSNNWKLKGANGGALKGVVSMNSDGQFSYKPDANYFGTDQFVYELCDGEPDCAEALVNITINSINDLPIAINDQYSTKQNQMVVGDVSLNDVASGDGGNLWLLVGANGGAANGTVSLDPLGTFSYQPKLDFVGSDVFQYRMCDTDPDCVTATVNITVEPTVGTYEKVDPLVISISPNPFQNRLLIKIDSKSSGTGLLAFFNILGKCIEEQHVAINSGQQLINLNTSELKDGIYMLRIQIENHSQLFKLIKR
ncbi:MAG: tandem-95 repeat protein [Saprospiraceae bacterium]|nr:tandem-95 repeat protein [Saprospiraceae bacterium]MBK7738220.1 tandem-95 repeat protein [Saprospiraceae bacterium]MBK7913205.1 tandem-95 repeat protein [Saprospiraceae bacterium]